MYWEQNPYAICEDKDEEIFISYSDWLSYPISWTSFDIKWKYSEYLVRLYLSLETERKQSLLRLVQERQLRQFKREYTLARLLSPTNNQDDGFFFFH